MIKEAIFKIVDKQNLTYQEAYDTMNQIMSGETTPTQNAAFLAALSTKSAKAETIEEIAGCAKAMREHATQVTPHAPVLEIVGTGGDKSNSFNISTTASFVIAAGGQPVAKHGNRAASSKSGTADCQEALGVNINQDPELAVELLDEVGLCFFFAQKYHTSMKYVGPIRKELGIRTVFNILGPLTNPASPEFMVMGVYDEYLVQLLAGVLPKLGVKRGMIVHNRDHMDELTSTNNTVVFEIRDGWSRTYVISPEDFCMARGKKAELEGGTPEENAQITRDILAGQRGTKRDTVVLNAAAGLYISGKAETFADGVELAEDLIDSGAAMKVLEAYVAKSNQKEQQ